MNSGTERVARTTMMVLALLALLAVAEPPPREPTVYGIGAVHLELTGERPP